MVIKPGGQSRFWFANARGSVARDSLVALSAILAKVSPPPVTAGPVVFAIRGSVAGGEPGKLASPMPIPDEWKGIKPGEPLPDSTLYALWPDAPGAAKSQPAALEPLGGKVLRPRDWFFERSDNPSGVLWTISKEDPKKGYRTGMRIQLFVKVKEHGATPRSLIQDFVKAKHRSGKALRSCDTTIQGIFKRVCLDVEEKLNGDGELYHVVYSGFWSDEANMAIVSTFGAPASEWKSVEETANRMANFILLDLDEMKH